MAEAGDLQREPVETDEAKERRLCEIFGYVDDEGNLTHRFVKGEFLEIKNDESRFTNGDGKSGVGASAVPEAMAEKGTLSQQSKA